MLVGAEPCCTLWLLYLWQLFPSGVNNCLFFFLFVVCLVVYVVITNPTLNSSPNVQILPLRHSDAPAIPSILLPWKSFLLENPNLLCTGLVPPGVAHSCHSGVPAPPCWSSPIPSLGLNLSFFVCLPVSLLYSPILLKHISGHFPSKTEKTFILFF